MAQSQATPLPALMAKVAHPRNVFLVPGTRERSRPRLIKSFHKYHTTFLDPVPRPLRSGNLPTMLTAATAAELLQAQAELTCHALGYLKPMALHCVIKLGIPDAIDSLGGSASLSELEALLPVAPSKRPYLSRLMRLLVAMGIFREETAAEGARYHLTAASRFLLVGDGDGRARLSQFAANAVMIPFQRGFAQHGGSSTPLSDGAELVAIRGRRTAWKTINR
ncbi:hypothetical protein ACP70R_019881 [Stipagrostis hirtigluma subsp. patula]